MGEILWNREMIDPEKREILKAMGFGQVHLHDTPVFGPDFKDIVEQSDLIPSDCFVSLPDQKWEVIYMGKFGRDRMIIRERVKGPDGVIDNSFPYNWEKGIERLKQLLNGERKEEGTEVS
jgi:hypothetical protein